MLCITFLYVFHRNTNPYLGYREILSVRPSLSRLTIPSATLGSTLETSWQFTTASLVLCCLISSKNLPFAPDCVSSLPTHQFGVQKLICGFSAWVPSHSRRRVHPCTRAGGFTPRHYMGYIPTRAVEFVRALGPAGYTPWHAHSEYRNSFGAPSFGHSMLSIPTRAAEFVRALGPAGFTPCRAHSEH